MLFACSKEGIVLICYGAHAESDEIRNLARLVVIIGSMSSPLESFEVMNDGRVLIGKPFVISKKLFYVATERQRDVKNTSVDLLITHVTGSCMMVLFHNSLPHILQKIEGITSSALHNSKFSDSMGGDVLSMDDVLGALFETDEVKDDVLVFEEHFLRRIVEDTSTNWFADIIPLLLGQGPCPSCCIYLFERTPTDSLELGPLMPLYVDDCRETHNAMSTNVQTTVKPTLDQYRQALLLSYLSNKPLQGKAEVGTATRVILFPDHSAMLVCSITESIVLVVTTSQLTNLNNVPAVRDDSMQHLSVDSLPEKLRSAWLACCARIRRVFVQVEDLKDLPPALVDRINYILN